jgi:pullulanase/glycogen debranching enzyme
MKQTVASEQAPGRPADIVLDLTEGSSAPLGATPSPAGVNFSVYSKHAQGMELLLFESNPQEIRLRTGQRDEDGVAGQYDGQGVP